MVHVDISVVPKIVRDDLASSSSTAPPSAAHQALCAAIGKIDDPMVGDAESANPNLMCTTSNPISDSIIGTSGALDTGSESVSTSLSTPSMNTVASVTPPVPVVESGPKCTTSTSPAPATVIPPTPAHGPSLASVLKQQEELRKDKEQKKAKYQVEMPKPLGADIYAIEKLYADGRPDWDVVAAKISAAQPYQLLRAEHAMIIETGQELGKTSPAKILSSFLRDHGNSVVNELLDTHQIGQIYKLPGGHLRVMTATIEACKRLECQEVTILGSKYKFRSYDALSNKFFLDVFGITSVATTDNMLRALYTLGCSILYADFREVNHDRGIAMSSWRVYFNTDTCPVVLLVNGKICDQLELDNRLYPSRGKNAPISMERVRYGQRSQFCLQLAPKPAPRKASSTGASLLAKATSKTQAVPQCTKVPIKKPETNESPAVEHTDKTSGADTHASKPKPITPKQNVSTTAQGDSPTESMLDDADAISLECASPNNLTPPGSPAISAPKEPRRQQTITDEWMTARSLKKRNRKHDVFTHLISRAQPKPLEGLATSNYFEVLRSLDVEYEKVELIDEATLQSRYHIFPTSVQGKTKITESKEAAHFFSKRHTKVIKDERPIRVAEVAKIMVDDIKSVMLPIQPDKIVQANARIPGAQKMVLHSTNGDSIIQLSSNHPLTVNGVILQCMNRNDPAVDTLSTVHMINRIMAASEPTSSTTFAHKYTKYFGKKVPSKRQDLIQEFNKRWTCTEDILELKRVTQALSFFEIILMCTAPSLFNNDHWIQYITGQPVLWIPTQHGRLLHPNILICILRSHVGTLCMSQWFQSSWKSQMYQDLEDLSLSNTFLHDETAVLQLNIDDKDTLVVAGPLSSHC